MTLPIIVFTCVLSIFCFSNENTFEKLTLVPYLIAHQANQAYRLISHAFIHANLGHLAFNMLTLFFFGRELEKILLPVEYLAFYLCALLLSSLPSYQTHRSDPDYRAVGASGAVSAVMFALVLYAPWSVIYLKFIIPIYFIIFALGYLAYSYYQSSRSNDGIAHDVHLWGALFGMAYMLIFHPSSLRVFLDQLLNPPFLN